MMYIKINLFFYIFPYLWPIYHEIAIVDIKLMAGPLCITQLVIILCVFWGISLTRRTLECWLPQFYMFPYSHGNISFLQKRLEARNKKESCLLKGRFLHSYTRGGSCLVHSPKVHDRPRAQALGCPLPQENALIREPPLQLTLQNRTRSLHHSQIQL
jgi:hypothetical protein